MVPRARDIEAVFGEHRKTLMTAGPWRRSLRASWCMDRRKRRTAFWWVRASNIMERGSSG